MAIKGSGLGFSNASRLLTWFGNGIYLLKDEGRQTLRLVGTPRVTRSTVAFFIFTTTAESYIKCYANCPGCSKNSPSGKFQDSPECPTLLRVTCHPSVIKMKKLRVREEKTLGRVYFERDRLCTRPPSQSFAVHWPFFYEWDRAWC